MQPQPESAIVTWAVPESPVSIEYPAVLLQQVNAYVLEGFHRLSRGGMEVGGVLFGYRDRGRLRLETWRPIACEYSKGPCFALSENDQVDLERILAAAAKDPRLSGLEPLGWFVSHTRSGLALVETDQEVIRGYFGDPWQVTLVLHPQKNVPTRASFFARDLNGVFPVEARHEFAIDDRRSLDRRAGERRADRVPIDTQEPDRREGERRVTERRAVPAALPRSEEADIESGAIELYAPARQSARPVPRLEAAQPAAVQSPPQAPVREFIEAPQFGQTPARRGHQWGRLAVILVVLAACAAAGAYYLLPATNRSFAFDAEDSNGQLRIHWDQSAKSIREATRGVLEIKDAGQPASFELDAEHVRAGSFTYTRRGEDVDMRLTVYPQSDSPLTELSHFIGPPSVNSELAALRKERDHLRAQVADLENQLDAEQKKSAKLEQVNKLKENLLQLDNVLSRGQGAPAPTPPK
jgi:hypothetical protein